MRRKIAKAVKRKFPIIQKSDDDESENSDSDEQQMPWPPAAASGGKNVKRTKFAA